jgi:hypothetical protein
MASWRAGWGALEDMLDPACQGKYPPPSKGVDSGGVDAMVA